MTFKVANLTLDGRMAGPQNQILQVAERLEKHGIETVVIIPRKESGSYYRKLLERKIRVHRPNLHRLTRDWPHLVGYICFFLLEVFSIYRYLKRENIRLVHCNCAWQVKGVIAGRMARAKVIWHLQDTSAPRSVRILFGILAYLFCDGFIVAGEEVRKHYLQSETLKKKRTVEIQAPVDTSRFRPKDVVRDKRIGSGSGIKITTVGNINPDKGFEYFIEMANFLNEKYQNLFFWIVGPYIDSQTRYWGRLNQLVSKYGLENLLFYGRSDNVPSVLKATDIFVCTSVTEASPMSVWEAMAMEKAVVCTDVGDVSRFLKDGESGFIVPPADANKLAEKVGILIEKYDLRRRFGKRARAAAVGELDIERSVDRHRKFYIEYLRIGHGE